MWVISVCGMLVQSSCHVYCEILGIPLMHVAYSIFNNLPLPPTLSRCFHAPTGRRRLVHPLGGIWTMTHCNNCLIVSIKHVQYFYASTVLYPTLSSLGSTVLASIQYLFELPVCDFEI